MQKFTYWQLQNENGDSRDQQYSLRLIIVQICWRIRHAGFRNKIYSSKTDERDPHLIHCGEMMTIKEKEQIRKDQEIIRPTAQQPESEDSGIINSKRWSKYLLRSSVRYKSPLRLLSARVGPQEEGRGHGSREGGRSARKRHVSLWVYIKLWVK